MDYYSKNHLHKLKYYNIRTLQANSKNCGFPLQVFLHVSYASKGIITSKGSGEYKYWQGMSPDTLPRTHITNDILYTWNLK